MKDRELMQMALDALMMCNAETMYASQRAAINRLSDRLAQPEPEPVLWERREDGKIGPTNAPPKREWVGFTSAERDEIVPMLVQSLINHDDKTMTVLLRAIFIDVEAKLKEKNR